MIKLTIFTAVMLRVRRTFVFVNILNEPMNQCLEVISNNETLNICDVTRKGIWSLIAYG